MDVKQRVLAAALAVFALAAAPAAAAPGDLDPSFSNDGRVSTLTSPDTFVARAVAVQPDGRIVVAGYSCDTGTCGPTGDSSFRLVRYTADGGLDTDFGDGRDGHDRDRGRAARRPTTCSCAPTAASSPAAWRAWTCRTRARSRSRATCPTGASTRASARAAAC